MVIQSGRKRTAQDRTLDGLTYEEINVLVYFILVPVPYLYILDIKIGGHYLILGFLVFAAAVGFCVRPFSRLSSILFSRSVRLLESFHAVGLNYVQASVVTCVIVPCWYWLPSS